MNKRDEEIKLSRKAAEEKLSQRYTNKQRLLLFTSRGVNSLQRHLSEDLRSLLPHSKKENKHDTKRNLSDISDLCQMRHCNSCIFFEARKKNLFLWISKPSTGPGLKFLVSNIHTLDELRLSGNCLKFSRPILSFDQSFKDSNNNRPWLQLVKELLTQTFGTPRGHPKSKPFIDHVLSFSYLDNKIWFRHFQIVTAQGEGKAKTSTSLVEIGPRFVLDLVKIFKDPFGGEVLYENPSFIKPTKAVISQKRKAGKSDADKKDKKYVNKLKQKAKKQRREEMNPPKEDKFAGLFE